MDNFNLFRELLLSNRSIRRFDNSRPIPRAELERLVELTRYCASGRNLQPLRYRIVCTADECAALFPALAWAGYYKDWDGPAPAERPVAYLVQCLDTSLTDNPLCDEGLQLEAVTLGASAMGIHGCIIKAFNAATVKAVLHLPDSMKPCYVLALGYPAETARIVDMTDGDYRYFRNDADEQCVPKRPLSELLIHP